MAPPVFINCRDRLSSLLELVAWLERVGVDEIYLLDNDSAYGPLLEYYERTPHTVIRLAENYGRFALYEAPGVFERTRGRAFVYTDPDIIPCSECPPDALDRFAELLERYPVANKVGFGLRIDDLPDHYAHKAAVVSWEEQFWTRPVERGAYWAPIDTTFALYRANGTRALDGIRTGSPYMARHETWYLDFDNLGEEDRFYQHRAAEHTQYSPGTSHWATSELSTRVAKKVDALRRRRSSAIARLSRRLRWSLYGRRALRRQPDR
jgi:hypothetical protein